MVAEVVSIGDQRLALGEVIQRAEVVLQILERRESRLSPRGILLSGEDAGEELDRVAQILCPDAELVPLLNIERAQIRTVLPDPFPPAREQLGGMIRNRLLT